jgi:hypothetical protein
MSINVFLPLHIKRYIQTFQSGFDEGLRDVQVRGRVWPTNKGGGWF